MLRPANDLHRQVKLAFSRWVMQTNVNHTVVVLPVRSRRVIHKSKSSSQVASRIDTRTINVITSIYVAKIVVRQYKIRIRTDIPVKPMEHQIGILPVRILIDTGHAALDIAVRNRQFRRSVNIDRLEITAHRYLAAVHPGVTPDNTVNQQSLAFIRATQAAAPAVRLLARIVSRIIDYRAIPYLGSHVPVRADAAAVKDCGVAPNKTVPKQRSVRNTAEIDAAAGTRCRILAYVAILDLGAGRPAEQPATTAIEALVANILRKSGIAQQQRIFRLQLVRIGGIAPNAAPGNSRRSLTPEHTATVARCIIMHRRISDADLRANPMPVQCAPERSLVLSELAVPYHYIAVIPPLGLITITVWVIRIVYICIGQHAAAIYGPAAPDILNSRRKVR